MSPDRAHLAALVMSEQYAMQADLYRALKMPSLALRERAMAVVTYDRTLNHWSINGPQPTPGTSPQQQ